MKLSKVLSLVVLSGLYLSLSAFADDVLHSDATYSFEPTATEHNWCSFERWAINDGSGWSYPFDSVPGTTNTVNLGNTTPVNYAEILSGDAAQALHFYFGTGVDNTLNVDGSLVVSGDFVYGSGAEANGTAVVAVNSGASLSVQGNLLPYNSNPATLCKIVQNGGAVEVSGVVGIQNAGSYQAMFSCELKGGYFNPGYVAFYDSGDGSNFSIDIDGGDLVMNNYGHFTDDLVAKGCILAEGSVVTSSNMSELLQEDWNTYPGKVAFRVKPVLRADFDNNGKVDLVDFSLFVEEWLRVNELQ